MKKTILLLVAVLALAVYCIGLNETAMRKIDSIPNKNRYNWLQSDKYAYGDLFGMSYLKDFKPPAAKQIRKIGKRRGTNAGNIHLYMLGDSFMGNFLYNHARNQDYFCNTDSVNFLWIGRDQPRNVQLSSSKRNILIIEHTERLIRQFYNGPKPTFIFDNFRFINDTSTSATKTLTKTHQQPKSKRIAMLLMNLHRTRIGKFIFNPLINQNLEKLLFDYRLFTPIKELKAGLNYHLFDRVNSSVVVSRDKQNLFYNETVDSALITSSFKPLSTQELKKIVDNLNAVYSYFKAKGFDEVYFTITPNSVSVIEPNRMSYNHLISRLHQQRNLQMPVIDVYTRMIHHPDRGSLYFRSDTHWNENGFQLWLDEANKVLNHESAKELAQ